MFAQFFRISYNAILILIISYHKFTHVMFTVKVNAILILIITKKCLRALFTVKCYSYINYLSLIKDMLSDR